MRAPAPVVAVVIVVGTCLRATPAVAQETARMNVDSTGAPSNSNAYYPSISGDGRFVSFASWSDNLVSGDTNRQTDIFVHDRGTGITERVSVSSSGVEGNGFSYDSRLSADGRFVAFESAATNLIDGTTVPTGGIFVRDRKNGTTELASVDSAGNPGTGYSQLWGISADGSVVAFSSGSTNLVAGDTNKRSDAFVHDRSTGVTERVSVDSSGAEGNADSYAGGISADGSVAVVVSYATNLVPGDTNQKLDVFVRDRTTGVTERVSVDSTGREGGGDSYRGVVSADGSIIAFSSVADDLVGGDLNGGEDVFVRDRVRGVTELATVDSSGFQGNGLNNTVTGISSDGRFVVFASDAMNLVDGDDNDWVDVFVRDRATGFTKRSSVDSGGCEANSGSDDPSMSADGQVVAFHSYATNLVDDDTNGFDDVFVHEHCPLDAAWVNYDVGFPGTYGVPAFTARSLPVLGSALTLDLANSLGNYTFGLLFVGFDPASIHSAWGGDLLLLPTYTVVLGLPPTGISIGGDVPLSDAFCGLAVELQAIESDAGAAHGVSFTQGLELRLGR
ncbi:MAG TPA: calcium-binding protein [Planctomycetota bacterium]|nr:calcium-binding protein [Planctomycetota bacterium]